MLFRWYVVSFLFIRVSLETKNKWGRWREGSAIYYQAERLGESLMRREEGGEEEKEEEQEEEEEERKTMWQA